MKKLSHFSTGLLTVLLGAQLMVGNFAYAADVDQLKNAISKNPEILFEAIEKNPVKFMEAVEKASMSARKEMQAKAEDDQKVESRESESGHLHVRPRRCERRADPDKVEGKNWEKRPRIFHGAGGRLRWRQ
jgi:FtsZ-interacting cell division protein ZipA